MLEDVRKEAEEKVVGDEGETNESVDRSDISKDISELVAILSENPEVEQQVIEVIEYHLKDNVDHTTFKKVHNALKILLGKNAARITINSCRINNHNFFDAIKNVGEEATVDKSFPFLKQLAAIYGTKIQEIYDLSVEIPEDWESGSVELYQREDEELWFIEMDLIKYNRDRVFLRMPVSSTFNLARVLLKKIGKLPMEAVDGDIIEVFKEETEEFKNKFLSDNGDHD